MLGLVHEACQGNERFVTEKISLSCPPGNSQIHEIKSLLFYGSWFGSGLLCSSLCGKCICAQRNCSLAPAGPQSQGNSNDSQDVEEGVQTKETRQIQFQSMVYTISPRAQKQTSFNTILLRDLLGTLKHGEDQN